MIFRPSQVSSKTMRMGLVHRKRLIRIALVIFCCAVAYLTFGEFQNKWLRIQYVDLVFTQPVCHHPNLDINNEMISKYIEDVGELRCDQKPNWLYTHKGHVFVNQDVAKKHGEIACLLTYIVRVTDFKTKNGKQVVLSSKVGSAKLESDFFTANCKAKDGTAWKNVMAGVYRNETAVAAKKKAKLPDGAWNLNVLMFGFDSVSRAHFLRKLPTSVAYLTDTLNATVLQGYNIVGDGTPQALIPILTGKTEPELPETRHRVAGAHRVNVYPFIWNLFKSLGYVTAYGEDMSHIGTFTYRMTGFDEQPTDHYLRPFYQKVESSTKNHPKYCLRNTTRHRVMMDWLREFYDVYSDLPKFTFLFHSELSHDSYNTIGYVDRELKNFLQSLNEDGVLNNTLLIVMSDHGHRFASIRETQQGKQEERLPFFSIRVPPWLETHHPEAVRNLRKNEHRLTTPFDIYSTLMTVLYPDVKSVGSVKERSISLFSEVPPERTCKDADIEPHWCACLAWANRSTTDKTADRVAQSVVDLINGLTAEHRTLCALLGTGTVTRLQVLEPNEALLKFKKNADPDGFKGDFSDNTKVTEVYYQIQLRAKPSQAVYEATIRHNLVKDELLVNEKDVSRVNTYDKEDHCIHDTVPRLGKYCYCKDLLPTGSR